MWCRSQSAAVAAAAAASTAVAAAAAVRFLHVRLAYAVNMPLASRAVHQPSQLNVVQVAVHGDGRSASLVRDAAFWPQRAAAPQPAPTCFAAMPLSCLVRAQRALVSVLLVLARAHGVVVPVTRESTEAEVAKAYRRVAKLVHPDKGGRKRDFQELQAKKEVWDAARAAHTKVASAMAMVPAVPGGFWAEKGKPGYRVRSAAVLLTYSGKWSVALWRRFVSYVRKHLTAWGVLHWCGTLECSEAGHLHVHLALQFRCAVDRSTQFFAWAGRVPNASTNDYLGQGLRKDPRFYQQSVDRGFFYVFADKDGTQRDQAGNVCVDGNHFPCWVKAPRSTRYQVLGKWPLALWQQHKLSHGAYEEYLFLCRDSVVGRKRNLDAVCQWEERMAEDAERAATAARARTRTFQGFSEVPEVTDWLACFDEEVDRYPFLVLLGPSRCRKTEYAKSLFKAPLELKIGTLDHFPEGMRAFSRKKHDAVILDDCRDFAFLVHHQEKLQAKSDALIEFASTPGGQLAYSKWLHRIPIVVTANHSTQHPELLQDDDFLGNADNRVLIRRSAPF